MKYFQRLNFFYFLILFRKVKVNHLKNIFFYFVSFLNGNEINYWNKEKTYIFDYNSESVISLEITNKINEKKGIMRRFFI